MANDSNPREGQPVEPEEARAHGNDPDAVRVEGNERSRRGSRREETTASAGETDRERQSSSEGASRQETASSRGDEGAHVDNLALRTGENQDSGR